MLNRCSYYDDVIMDFYILLKENYVIAVESFLNASIRFEFKALNLGLFNDNSIDM